MKSIFDEFDVRVLRLFSRGEAFDSDGFATLFCPDAVYQFGNSPPSRDRPSIRRSVSEFFDLVEALYHNIRTIQTVGDTAFVEMDVCYWRKSAGLVTLPCLDVVRFDEEGLVTELRIGMDAAPVGDPTIDATEAGSMFALANGSSVPSREPMRHYFADHPEGRDRISHGFPPKWSMFGPRWPLSAAGAS